MAKTANVGRLSISLDANTIRYINNIKKAGLETERRVNMMNKAFSRLKKKSDTSLNKVIGRLGGLAAAYLSVGFAMQKFNQNREMLDQLAKTSDALGINQEKLQALHHVGELNGVTVTQLNLSLQRMQRNLGDAADGTGQTAKALLKLGISIREIEDMSPDKQMELLAKELTSVEKQTDKAKLAQDFFGRNGVRVLKVLEALKKDGLEPTSQALEDMGVNLKRIETKKIEDMNDAIFKVTEVLSGLINRVIIKLAPHLEKFADYFLDLTKETKGFSDQLALSFNIIWRAVLIVTGVVRQMWNLVQIAFNGWESLFVSIVHAAEDWGVQAAHLVFNVKSIFIGVATTIQTSWTTLFSNMKIMVNEWVMSIGKTLSKVPLMEDLGASMVAGAKAGISTAKMAIIEADKVQAGVDAAKLAREKLLASARLELLKTHDAAQAVIAAKIKTNANDLLAATQLISDGIFNTGAALPEEKEDPEEDPEIKAEKDKWEMMLANYKGYLSAVEVMEADAKNSTLGGYAEQADALGALFGEQLGLQETYAKASAAIQSVQAVMQVWSDPTMTFYEKIPAAIAAASAVASLMGQFHGGTDEVPQSMDNKSFMLKAGERVVQPEANKKLTSFLDDMDTLQGGTNKEETNGKQDRLIASMDRLSVGLKPEDVSSEDEAFRNFSSMFGQFHGGTDEVPQSMDNKSFMLKAGERVVQPEANKKLTKFLDSGENNGAGAGAVTISADMNVTGNVTDQTWFKQELYKHRQLISDSARKAQREKPRR